MKKLQPTYIDSWLVIMKVARIYLRVSTDEQDLARQASIEHSTRDAGYYVAGIYREKASSARADRPELLRMIADLQPGAVVVAEKIDRISRLPLIEAGKAHTSPLRLKRDFDNFHLHNGRFHCLIQSGVC